MASPLERAAGGAAGTVWALWPSCNSPLRCWRCQLHQQSWGGAFPVQRGWSGGWEGMGTGPGGVAAASLFPSALCKHRQMVLMDLFPVKSTDLVTSGCFLSLLCLLKLLFRFLGFSLKITSMSSSSILKTKVVPHFRTGWWKQLQHFLQLSN